MRRSHCRWWWAQCWNASGILRTGTRDQPPRRNEWPRGRRNPSELRNVDCCACARVDVIVAERFSQPQECRLSGAVAGSDLLQLPFRSQIFNDAIDILLRRCDQVQATEYNVKARIDLARGRKNLLDASVRAAVN